MSLAEAITALRDWVPSASPTESASSAPVGSVVPSPENPTEPLEAAPHKGVPPVPLVPSEKRMIGRNSQHPPESLSDTALAELVTQAARRFKLLPADLWAFLSLEDLDALRTGDPQELNALGAFAESVSRTGERIMGGHNLPFPGEPEPAGAHHGPVCCGDCGHFQRDTIGDGHGIGRCAAGVPPRPGVPAKYPKAERYCRVFCAKEAGRDGAN
ncbi:hypothetical protein [Methylomagnum sp.]